jgi:hypothetical protein
MTNSNARRGLAAGVLVALALALILAPTTPSISARTLQGPSAPSAQIGVPLVIPGAAFHSDGYDPDSMFFSFWGGFVQGGNINTCVTAPAYLPDGVTVYDTYASVVDNDAANRIWVDLYRVNNYTGVVDVMAAMGTEGAYASPSIVTLNGWPVTYPVVGYPDYSYYVGACLESANIRLYSVRLWYFEYELYLPSLFKP